jgi:TRAP-type C4-dicarboxylate transport system permease small subunit
MAKNFNSILLRGENRMEARKLAAIVLIVVGALGLVYGGFSYTKETHRADVGALHMSLDENQHVSVPVWAGVGAIVIGGLLLLIRGKD